MSTHLRIMAGPGMHAILAWIISAGPPPRSPHTDFNEDFRTYVFKIFTAVFKLCFHLVFIYCALKIKTGPKLSWKVVYMIQEFRETPNLSLTMYSFILWIWIFVAHFLPPGFYVLIRAIFHNLLLHILFSTWKDLESELLLSLNRDNGPRGFMTSNYLYLQYRKLLSTFQVS